MAATMQRVCEHLCPRFQLAMEVLSRPWNGLIMASLEDGPVRFGELLARIEHVGDRMLSARLKELATRGLVDRRVIPGPPVRVEYELTTAGRGFKQVLQAIARWGSTFKEPTPAKPRAKAAKTGATAKVSAPVKVGARKQVTRGAAGRGSNGRMPAATGEGQNQAKRRPT